MLEGFALLMAILGFIILRQTTKKYRKMRDINRNKASVIGTVVSNTVVRNLLGGPGFGTAYHTLIQYQPPGAREPYELYIFEHNLIMSYEYTKVVPWKLSMMRNLLIGLIPSLNGNVH